MPVDVCQTQNKHGPLPADAHMARHSRLVPLTDTEHYYDDLSEVQRERHESGMRLMYAFEHIVDKYSHVSIELGYEIDLGTGEIVERQWIHFFYILSIKCEVFLV